MSEQENRRTVERLIEATNDGNLELSDELYHADAVLEYPQSNERIVGRENRRAVFAAFPAPPTVTERRITALNDVVLLEATFDYGEGPPWLGVVRFELRDGRISRETGYWAEPSSPAPWRATWSEPIDA